MKIKRMILLVSGMLIMYALSAQSYPYIEYYTLCNEADKNIYDKNYTSALENYEKAFALVTDVHTIYYEKASEAAAICGANEKSVLYARKAVLQGGSDYFLKNKIFRNVKKTTVFKTMKDSLAIYKDRYRQRVNPAYQKEIDSLYYIDQHITRNAYWVKGNFNIDEKKIKSLGFGTDSLLFHCLLELMKKYGFPSEKNIGVDGYSKANILIHHSVRLPENEKYIDMFKAFVFTGEYMPADYAWMYDQSLAFFKKEKPYFYYGVYDNSKLTAEQIKDINEIRKAYGIKPVEAFEYLQHEHSFTMNTKW